MPTTEVAVHPLLPGINIHDQTNEGAIAVHECFDITRGAEGVQECRIGMQVEQPGVLECMVVWDDASKHQAWFKHPDFQQVMSRVGKFMGGEGQVIHVDFEPVAAHTRAIHAPVTEVARFYFNGSPPNDFLDGVLEFGKVLESEHVAGMLGAAAGVSHDDVEYDGVKGKMIVFAIGWESVEAHQAFTKTELFKEKVPLMGTERAAKVETHHTAFVSSKKVASAS